ncbi:MAG: tRNA (guanosine(46)-N7)-methyltransferase TrmB, partial [Lachnospiraceae bacterium]|nr:tRNA (guanosine(46)-N7)-methyltransferase TrmB [Lachnospiraceae bacterium]
MRLRKVKGAAEAVKSHPFVISDGTSCKGKWSEVFNNNNPIHVEIGMGKGKFITTLATLNKDINYIGIEQYDSVLVRALEKVDAMEEKPSNLLFMCVDAKTLTELFGNAELDRIYLNFSDPWPKDKHAKRR